MPTPTTEEREAGAIPAVFIPSLEENKEINHVLNEYTKGRSVVQKTYNQFNGRNLYDCIDDWTKRWNGYIPAANPLLDISQSQIFLNYTRNAVIAYLVNVSLTRPEAKIIAVNRKNNVENKRFAEIISNLNTYSLNNESGDKKFFEAALECTTKGTVILYEGYAKNYQEVEVPQKYDAETGKIKTKKEKRVLFDDCFQKIVPIEDFFICNPYQPDIQKQPFILWREVTTYFEAEMEYSHYKNWEYVQKGQYTVTADPSTFYRNALTTELGKDQVEILRYYNRAKNKHIIMINGVPVYSGPIPFKDGKYPFAKGIYEPFGNDFFWGAGFPNKIQGEQDLKNTFWNMMVDKTAGSLLPYGLTSDLDDIIEDDVLAPNKIRQVGDINKWKIDTLPGVNAGEVQMLQLTDRYMQEDSGDVMGSSNASSPRGGKLPARQIMLKQQESMKRLGFSMGFLEDLERDRTQLRVSHILQFYSIPKIEKITGRSGELQQFVYRDITLNNVKLSDGQVGNKVIKLTDKLKPNARKKMADELSVIEMMGEESGVPTEAVAIDVNTFYDWNLAIQIVKNSSYERNEVLDQASRMEFAQWRLGLAQIAPVNAAELVKWVEESFDVDTDRFIAEQGPEQMMNAAAGQGENPIEQGNRPLEELNRTDNTSAIARATQ